MYNLVGKFEAISEKNVDLQPNPDKIVEGRNAL